MITLIALAGYTVIGIILVVGGFDLYFFILIFLKWRRDKK